MSISIIILTIQLSQKMRYRVENLGTWIKGTKVSFYGPNFLELKKKL